MTDEIFVAVI